MTIPDLTITELQNALRILPASADDVFVVVGCSSRGPGAGVLAAEATIAGLAADYGDGPAVEMAALLLSVTGGTPVIMCRTPASTPGVVAGVAFTPALAGGANVGGTAAGAGGAVVLTTIAAHLLPDRAVVTVALIGGTTEADGTFIAHVVDSTPTSYFWDDLGPRLDERAGTVQWTGVVSTGTGTSVPTFTGTPVDSYEPLIQIVGGGTVGTAGITFTWSLDNGRTVSALTALGTATTFALGASGLVWNAAAGTLVAGDNISLATTEPQPVAGDLTTAFAALAAGQQRFGGVAIAGAMTGTEAATIATGLAALRAAKKLRGDLCIFGARNPNPGESDAAWQASIAADFAAVSGNDFGVCAGPWRQTSAISGRQYTRPITAAAVVARAAAVPIYRDLAKVADGVLKTGTLFDSTGNPIGHDERTNPGLDALKFITIRTFGGLGEQVYITNPNLFSAVGSDFDLIQKRRVINVAEATIYITGLTVDLSAEEAVDPVTGFILETAARDIENDMREALTEALGPAISNPSAPELFILSRTDPVLTNGGLLTWSSRLEPLAYVKRLTGTIGFTAGTGA